MGIREDNINRGSGYRIMNYEMIWALSVDNDFHAIAGVPAVGLIDHTAFSGNKMVINPRTVTVSVVTDATVATRVLRARVHGYDFLGRSRHSEVNITATASQTVRAETYDIFAFIETFEIVSATGFVAGDSTRLGVFFDPADANVFRRVFWGLPLQLKGTRLDTTANQEGYKVDRGEIIFHASLYGPVSTVNFTFVLVVFDIANMRYDAERGGFRWILAPPALPIAGVQKLVLRLRVPA